MSTATAPSACRFCRTPLSDVFADLGMSPLANSYPTAAELAQMEPFYPLRALVCRKCLLVQLEEFESPENIFSDYAYFSSYSSSWVDHARRYVEAMIERFGFGPEHQVVEIASNDGYLLQWFREAGVPVLGVEPAANVAEVARDNGIPTHVGFFGRATALTLGGASADLLVGNNVLAHVPELNEFVSGMKILLKPDGIITMEFPHLLRLIEEDQFDTIYHEHFSYFSFLTVREVFAAHGLRLWDVEEVPTHGGSLRVFGCHAQNESTPDEPGVRELLERERERGLDRLETYAAYSERVKEDKLEILEFLIGLRREGRSIVGYGAPAKGNTLLNYCGVGKEFLEFTVDRSPHKQRRFLPGTHIPIEAPERIAERRPDVVLILPWNLREEIMGELSHVREWGGRFAARAPQLQLFS
jgi:SAM-dependent methyltransferase